MHSRRGENLPTLTAHINTGAEALAGIIGDSDPRWECEVDVSTPAAGDYSGRFGECPVGVLEVS